MIICVRVCGYGLCALDTVDVDDHQDSRENETLFILFIGSAIAYVTLNSCPSRISAFDASTSSAPCIIGR